MGSKIKKGKSNKKSWKKTAIFWGRVLLAAVIGIAFFLFIQRQEHLYEYPDVKIEEYDESDIEYPLSDLDSNSYFVDEYSFRSYNDGKITSRRGIDISEHQGEINWSKVKEAGVDFAFIRIGYRTYDQGNIKDDYYFKYNIENAQANGIDVGVYFFSQAIDRDEAIEEAKYVIDKLKSYDLELPVAFDMEEVTGFMDRIYWMSKEDVTAVADAFCEEIEKNGYDSIIYTNPSWTHRKLDLLKLTSRKIWLANYTEHTTFPYRFEFWQYSETGTVDGINANVDLNIMFIRK